jgi:hypothetical protein
VEHNLIGVCIFALEFGLAFQSTMGAPPIINACAADMFAVMLELIDIAGYFSRDDLFFYAIRRERRKKFISGTSLNPISLTGDQNVIRSNHPHGSSRRRIETCRLSKDPRGR